MKVSVLAGAVALALASSAQAAPFTLTFEGAGDEAQLLNFYNGGTDSLGNSGTNYQVGFGANALSLIDADAGGTGNFANEPTPNTVLFFLTGSAVLNYAPGFTTGFSFYYTSAFSAVVNVYDGLDATGNLLASIDLGANYNTNCTGDPSGNFCHWDIASAAFAGTAYSVDFGGTVNQVGYDNITFGSTDPNPAPEPASLALVAAGLAGAIGMRRRKVSN